MSDFNVKETVIMNNKPLKRNSHKKLSENLWGYLILAPFLLFYLLFNFYPLIQGFIISFYQWNITGNKVFIGLDNYLELFKDDIFWQALGHILMYVGASTPIFVVGAFILAIIVNYKFIIGRTFLRATFFLPNVLAVSITAVIWLNIMQPYTGLMNAVLHAVGISQEIFWISDVNMVWPSIILITFWWNTGYYMILYIAGLQDIPQEQYEAAEIDGANWLQTIFHIVIPSLKNIHVLVIFLQVVSSFKLFGQVFLITEGGPGGASRSYIQYIYEEGFQKFFIGKASAASFILLVIIIAVSSVQLKLMSKNNN